jgi:hypothetical protein
VLFAYFGPETVLPLASVVATVIGAVMMFGRSVWHYAAIPVRWVLNRSRPRSAEPLLKGPTAWRRGKTVANAEATATLRESAEEA